MFALDNLVRGGVQSAFSVLLPELDENFANTSPVSTTESSAKLQKETDNLEIAQLRAENLKLNQELVESYKQYQQLVRYF